MERLTDARLAFPSDVWIEATRENREILSTIPVPTLRELYYRLALIEDILGDDYDLDRLRELVETDAEDRCVVLPRFKSPAHADPVGSPGTPGPAGHNQELVEFAEDVIRQFGYHCSADGRAAYTAGGSSTLEEAFRIAGWDDPHSAPECECEEEDCHKWGICGVSTPDGYKRLCIKHCLMYKDREVAIKAALKAREQDG